jgi:tetratricopeptide (TPR) repeat protein
METQRLEDLRRRVEKDPASIAFAQLAEEYRRAGLFTQAVDSCRSGLAIHPTYLSARVTLGRALLELGLYDEAKGELELVLKGAPENLAALRGLAEIAYKQGELPQASELYRAALALAPHDPDLEQMVQELERRISLQTDSQTDATWLDEVGQALAHATARTDVPSNADVITAATPAESSGNHVRADRTLAALEQWLAAIHAARAQSRA